MFEDAANGYCGRGDVCYVHIYIYVCGQYFNGEPAVRHASNTCGATISLEGSSGIVWEDRAGSGRIGRGFQLYLMVPLHLIGLERI